MNPNTNKSDQSGPSPARPHYPAPKIDDTSPHSSPPSRGETVREIVSTIGVIIAALLVAFALIAWVFQSYEVDGPSMESTLHNNDRLIVWKVPRTISRITGHQYVPNRGDIIIFVESGLSNFSSSDSKQLIKRVIGLPGERISVHNGVLTVYNKEHPEGFSPDKTMSYGKVVDEASDQRDQTWTLGPNELFVCGDNRPNSLDSRTFGAITTDQVVGKLVIRLLPIGQIEKF